jgi:hypothetical protein
MAAGLSTDKSAHTPVKSRPPVEEPMRAQEGKKVATAAPASQQKETVSEFPVTVTPAPAPPGEPSAFDEQRTCHLISFLLHA